MVDLVNVFMVEIHHIMMRSNQFQQKILLLMYGLVNKTADTGVVVTADNGATMLNLYADISGRIDSYNRISYEAFLREAQTVWIGLGAAAKPHVKWTEDRLLNDVELNYHFLEAKDNNYNDMAKFYRRYLGLEDNDKTTSTVLNLELIGSYDYDTNFLGIGYTAYDSLTTYKQAMEIIEEMRGQEENTLMSSIEDGKKMDSPIQAFLS